MPSAISELDIFNIVSFNAKKPKIFAIYSAILYSCVHIPPFSLASAFCKYSVFAMTDTTFFYCHERIEHMV